MFLKATGEIQLLKIIQFLMQKIIHMQIVFQES